MSENDDKRIKRLESALERIEHKLDMLYNGKVNQQRMTSQQAADYIGLKVSGLRRLVRNGLIPTHRNPGGKALYFLRNELDEWLTGRKA